MNRLITEIKKYLQNDYLKIGLVFVFLFCCLSLVYFSLDNFASLDDHFFHIRFAETIKNQGLDAFKDFHWLYFSKISINQQYFIYYNFLFYIFLIPFTFVVPLFLGIKLYTIFFAAIYFTILYFFLLKIKEKNPFFWVLIILAIMNYNSIWRFLLARPYAFTPAILLLELYFLYRRKYWGVFLISFLYLYWHSVTFFFPFGVALIYFAFESYFLKKYNWKILIYSLSGAVLSLFLMSFFAPGFFYYMKNICFDIFRETILGKRVGIAEGMELYPAEFIDFMRSNSVVMALLIISIVFEIIRYIKEKKGEFFPENSQDENKRTIKGTLFFLSILFLLGTFMSRRNNDLFVFFSAAYIAMSFNYFINYIKFESQVIRKALFIGIIIVVVYLFGGNLLFIYNQIASAEPHNSIEEAANWLEKNTNEGEIVFNASWNWFPTLFYYNQKNYYIAGIEPRFLYDYNHNLYWAWWNISNNGFLCLEEVCEKNIIEKNYYLRKDNLKNEWYEKEGNKIADYIKKKFKSRFIITSSELGNFNTLMDNNKNFKKVFTDKVYNKYLIYEIN